MVVSLLHTSDAGFDPFTDPGLLKQIDIAGYLAHPPEGCAVYYRASGCSSPGAIAHTTQRPGPDECRAFEERVTLTPISEWTLPAIPYRRERYTRDPIPVGFYRIVKPAAK
jgi:hypothetical protein